jgi:RNA polymerase sigma-70 factor (ECF subfamily)
MRIPPVTDADLAALAVAGDREAFGELIVRHAPAARRLTRAVLRDPHDADDAAQDGFLSAWRHLGRYDSSRPFGPWLLRIVLNAAHDLRRRRKVRSTSPLSEQQPGGVATPEVETERALLRHRLERALQELPERQRVAVLLFDGEGYSHGEIADLVGVPVGTVRSDVFHARRALREALGPYGGDSP